MKAIVRHKLSTNHQSYFSSTVLIFLIILFANSILHAQNRLWQFKTLATRTGAAYADTSPGIGDLDRDGIKDIIFCTTVGKVMAVNSLGYEMWTFEANAQITNPSVVVDLEGDKFLEVLVLTNTGKIICLDGESGVQLWNFNLPAKIEWGTTSIAAANLVDDNMLQIIVGDNQGNLTCLNHSGEELWSKKIDGKFNTAPAIIDLDGDGKNEILIGSTVSPLICFSNKGKELWRIKDLESSGSSPLVYDIDNDGSLEILLGCGNNLTLFDNKGIVLWQFPMKSSIHDAISVGDLTNNGKKEIIAVDLSGKVVCLNAKGKLKWSANALEKVRRSPAIADIDNDSKLEILIAGNNAHLYVFTAEGELREDIQLMGQSNATPTIVDFKNDGQLVVISPTDGDVSAFSWMESKPSTKPLVLFPEYRGNSARTGTSRHMAISQAAYIASIDYGDLNFSTNQFSVKVKNLKKEKLKLELKIIIDNAAPIIQTATFQDTSFVLNLPYNLTEQKASNVKFIIRLNLKDNMIIEREKSFIVDPYAKDIENFETMFSDIQSLLPKLSESVFVSKQLLFLQDRFNRMKGKMQIAGSITDFQRSELSAEVSYLSKETFTLWKLVKAAIDAGSTLVAYSANPWAPFGNTDEITEGRTAPANLSIHAFSGETESVAFNIANYSDKAIFVRIEPTALISEKDSSSIPYQKVIKYHELINVPTELLDMSGDALPLLGQAQTIMIPPWNLRQLWANVNTSMLSPGVWKNSILIRSLDVESKMAIATLTVNVSEIALPEEQALRSCQWGYVETSILKDIPQIALDDQISHGTNVFVANSNFVPKAEFDQDGNIIGNIDFTKHDEYMKEHSQHGIILFSSYQYGLKGPAEHFTPIWEKAHAAWLLAWFEHMKMKGIEYKDYALYPVDEPGLHKNRVSKYISYAKIIRQVNEKVQIYTDPVGANSAVDEGVSMNDLKNMAPYVDIWCPKRLDFLLNIGSDKLDFMKSTGKTVWTYDCQRNAKHQSPLGYYRSQSWLAFHHNLTGIGFWSYCTSKHDPWYIPYAGNDYLLVYQGDGVVTSKRWEAVRDGIEDYNMILLLKEALENASHEIDQKTIQAAKEILEKDVFEIATYCGMDAYGTQPQTIDGMTLLRQVEDVRWAKIQETRQKLANVLVSLQK